MKITDIREIAVPGDSGLIGSGWVTFFLWKGFAVNAYDINYDLLQAAKERVSSNIDYLVEKGIITKDAAGRICHYYFTILSFRNLAASASEPRSTIS